MTFLGFVHGVTKEAEFAFFSNALSFKLNTNAIYQVNVAIRQLTDDPNTR